MKDLTFFLSARILFSVSSTALFGEMSKASKPETNTFTDWDPLLGVTMETDSSLSTLQADPSSELLPFSAVACRGDIILEACSCN